MTRIDTTVSRSAACASRRLIMGASVLDKCRGGRDGIDDRDANPSGSFGSGAETKSAAACKCAHRRPRGTRLREYKFDPLSAHGRGRHPRCNRAGMQRRAWRRTRWRAMAAPPARRTAPSISRSWCRAIPFSSDPASEWPPCTPVRGLDSQSIERVSFSRYKDANAAPRLVGYAHELHVCRQTKLGIVQSRRDAPLISSPPAEELHDICAPCDFRLRCLPFSTACGS